MHYLNYEDYESLLTGGLAILLIALFVIVIGIAVIGIIANWKLLKKAGKKGWECIIPIYSYWVLVEIAGLNWWWFLLAILDVVLRIEVEGFSLAINLCSIFARFNIYYNIAKKFNKTNGTAVCAGLFNYIFILIFGFSKNEVYNTEIPVSKNGVFGTLENTTNEKYQSDVQSESTENTNVSASSNLKFKFCGNCGTKLSSDTKFCPNCGKESI